MANNTDNMTPQATSEPTYEPPRLTVLGSLADLTRGTITNGSDGINPGSLIAR